MHVYVKLVHFALSIKSIKSSIIRHFSINMRIIDPEYEQW